MKDSGNLLVNPDSVAKIMSQSETQSKNRGNVISTLLQEMSKEQD